MTLRAKLHAGLFALLIISIVASSITWWGSRRMLDHHDRVARAFHPLEVLLAIEADASEYVHRAEESALGAGLLPDLEAIRKRLDRLFDELQRSIAAENDFLSDILPEDIDPEELARAERMRSTMQLIYGHLEQAHALAAAGHLDQGRIQSVAAQHMFHHWFMSTLQAGIERELDEVREAEQRAARTADRVSTLILIVPVVSATIVLLVFILILPRLQRQLRHLNQATVQLSRGELDTRLPDLGNDELGQLAGAFNRMASELSSMTQRLENTRAQLVQAQKMDAIGQLAGGIAHDFNNILVVIMTNCDLLRDDTAAQPAWQAGLGEMLDASERAASLIRKLLAFSRHRNFEHGVVRVNDVIFEMSGMLRRLLRSDVELVVLTEEKLWHTRFDRSSLEQVLLNLVVNARDAMPRGGKLTVRTSNHVGADAAEAGEAPAGEHVLMEVTDTGSGMPPEVKARIFEPFFTTKGAGRGTGLGLATCYGMVTEAGGRIAVDTAPGQGTTFRIYLPRTNDAEVVASQREITAELYGEETILIVEDEPAVRASMQLALERYGYTVLAAENGATALRIIESRPASSIALVVTDMVMPQMNGIELAHQLQTRSQVPRILFVSGYADHSIVNRDSLRLGSGLLSKPFHAHELASAVRRALASR